MNAIKDSIKSGRTVVGTTVTPNIDVSIVADAGYDFLLFDTQHSAWEIKQLQPSIQTMRGKQAAPLVRVAANQAYQICFALDAGARGIVVPMVNTSAEAEAAVRACRYFPLGDRREARHRRRDVFHPARDGPELLRPEGVQVLHHAVGSLGGGRDPERPVRD